MNVPFGMAGYEIASIKQFFISIFLNAIAICLNYKYMYRK